MYRACLRILRDHDRAEDATHDAVVAAIANPPDVIEKDWGPWLCAVAQNTARQYLRRDARSRTVPLPDDLPEDDNRDERSDERGKEIQHLLDRATGLLSEDELADFELYREVRLTGLTQEELAKKLDLPLPEVRRRRKRALRAIRDAVVAVYLAENPGSGRNRCTKPRDLATAEADSPVLRANIMSHARRCTKVCKPKREVPKKLLRRLLAAPGLGLGSGLVAWLAELLTPKKVAVAATTTLVAVSFAVLAENEVPAPPDLVVVPPSRTTAIPPLPAPPLVPAPTSSQAPPAPPRQEPPPAPPPPPVTPEPEPGGGGRAEVPPRIAHGWVEHRRLVIDGHQRCDDDKPRTSGVAAVVRAPGGVRSVTVHLRGEGRDLAVPMTELGASTWAGRIGPFDSGTRGRYTVVIVAIGADGVTVEKEVAELCVTRCGGRAS